jgi:hypothetical protein
VPESFPKFYVQNIDKAVKNALDLGFPEGEPFEM